MADGGAHTDSPPSLNASLIVGPLLVANSLNWALWGILSVQLAFFVRDIRRRRRRRKDTGLSDAERGLSEAHADKRFGFRRKNANTSKSAFADDDVNPWRKTFVAPLAVPSISAYPSQHSRQRSSRSVPSSFDPYSPTAVHPSPVDADSSSMRFPSSNSFDPPSIYLSLALYSLYVFICAHTALETAQFWRVAVEAWGTGPSDLGPRWLGLVLADCIDPIVFAITVAYFIYVLYFSPSSTRMRSTGPSLRPLSLKSKANVLPEPYSFPYPQSPSSSLPSPRHRFWRPALLEPALLAIVALVVTVCGFVDCARLFKESPPPGAPVELNAVLLIWFAGQLAIDLLLCVLLCRSLGSRLSSSWTTRVVRFMGEAGGTQVVVVFVALVLIVSWREGKPPSTLTMVAPALLPVIYANTVLLHTASTYPRPTPEMPSPRTPSKSVRSKFEDIEMGLRGSSSRSPAHVDLSRAAAAAESAYSTTADSTDGGAALRAKAMAYGREKEAAAAAGLGSAAPAHMHLERDAVGESSTGNLLSNAAGGTASASANASEPAKMKAPSVRSGVSTALSLELPTFRRGRARWRSGYPMNVESGSEGSDEWEEEIEFDSEEEGGGTWDYGFANAEREKERAAAATMLAGVNSLSPNDTGTRIGVQGGGRSPWQNFTLQPGKRSSYPTGGPSRPTSWRRTMHPLATSTNAGGGDAEADENDDTLSMLSSTSAQRRRRYSHHRPPKRPQGPSFSKSKPLHRLLPRAPLPPPLPSAGSANASTDSVYLTGGGGGGLASPAGSVLVIGRGSLMREPSIAEQSINAAASVAATRASTGSMWSTFSYTYPRPFTLPDLDVDLQGGLGISTEESGDGVVGESTRMNGGGSGEGTRTGDSDLGAALALSSISGSGSGVGDSNAPHPYSAAAAGVGESSAGVDEQEGAARRRWNVHPLKRIADMGRLRF